MNNISKALDTASQYKERIKTVQRDDYRANYHVTKSSWLMGFSIISEYMKGDITV